MVGARGRWLGCWLAITTSVGDSTSTKNSMYGLRAVVTKKREIGRWVRNILAPMVFADA